MAPVSPVAPVAAVDPAASLVGGGATPTLEVLLGQLATAVQALAQALQGMGMLAPAGTVVGGGDPGVAPPGQSPIQSPVQQSPGQLPPAPPIKGDPTQSRSLGQRNAQDGPGVIRSVVSKQELERDPRLRGKLDPPNGGTPPKGVKVRTNADGTRVVTINIHGAAPKGKAITPGNESIQGLRDIAAYVNSIDPDVVMVQEINDRSSKVNDPGLSPVTSVFAHLVGASDMAYTPGDGGKGSRRGTAIFTRNDFTIDRAMNVDLPDKGDTARRSAGVAVIQPPDGRPAFTAISTHMSHMGSVAASNRRRDQMQELARVAAAIRNDGSFTYRTPTGEQHTATGFPQDRIVLGGDLNTTQKGRNGGIDSADRLLGTAGLKHANDLYGRGNVKPRIDHVYAFGFDATSSALEQVAARELQGDSPTDHPGYITDLV